MEVKFSDSIKEVITYSRVEAIRLNCDYISVEHIFLGLLEYFNQNPKNDIRFFNYFKIDKQNFKESIELFIKKENKNTNNIQYEGNIPLLKNAEKVLKTTYLEAKSFKSQLIGVNHLMLSILKDETNFVSSQLKEMYNVTYDIVNKELKKNEFVFFNFKESNEGNKKEKIESAKPLSLFFDKNEFSKIEIVEIIALLSEIYSSIGGDELIIEGMNNYEYILTIEPEFV